MSLISAGSISLDSTFNVKVFIYFGHKKSGTRTGSKVFVKTAEPATSYFSEPLPLSTVLDKKNYLRLLRRKEGPCFAAIQLGHQIVPIAVLQTLGM
jgi:hypothetical protein